MEKQVSILGCGWLGFPMARHLVKEGWMVKGSTTTSSKLGELNSEGIEAFKIELKEEKVIGDIQGFLVNSELLIIDIPPGLRREPNSSFVSKMNQLIKAISASEIKHIIYVSSTGVFQDHESIPTFTEHYKFTPKEVKESQLVQVEELIMDLEKVSATVIRFGGLIGKERHPVKYLSGKSGIKNPEAPVNLIHLENCILLLSVIIRQKKFGRIFHGVEDLEYSKKEYYKQKAEEFDLSVPEFKHEGNSVGKKISMAITARQLGFKLEVKV
jgi:nucleoside-diphosphate-sugar epimerase